MQEHTEQKILIYLFILLKKTIETRGYVIQSGYTQANGMAVLISYSLANG